MLVCSPLISIWICVYRIRRVFSCSWWRLRDFWLLLHQWSYRLALAENHHWHRLVSVLFRLSMVWHRVRDDILIVALIVLFECSMIMVIDLCSLVAVN